MGDLIQGWLAAAAVTGRSVGWHFQNSIWAPLGLHNIFRCCSVHLAFLIFICIRSAAAFGCYNFYVIYHIHLTVSGLVEISAGGRGVFRPCRAPPSMTPDRVGFAYFLGPGMFRPCREYPNIGRILSLSWTWDVPTVSGVPKFWPDFEALDAPWFWPDFEAFHEPWFWPDFEAFHASLFGRILRPFTHLCFGRILRLLCISVVGRILKPFTPCRYF